MIPEGTRGQGLKRPAFKGGGSAELCLEIYRITAKFPKEERYGLTSQIRRSVASIP